MQYDFSKSHHGKVYVKNSADSEEISRLKDTGWRPDKDLPSVAPPPGLSLERKYLFEKIHTFCLPQCQDSVCPETIQHHQPLTPIEALRLIFIVFCQAFSVKAITPL